MNTLHAYIDESRLRLTSDDPANLYIMVAVVVSSTDVLDIQHRLRDLLPQGIPRLHWRNDRTALRRKHLGLLAELHHSFGMDSLEAHATLSRAKREEAGRRLCLAALAAHLADQGVRELVIESRQDHQDVRDDRVLLGARDNRVIPRELQWRHGRPLAEPLLWPPDAIAGVVGHQLAGRPPDPLADLLRDALPTTVWAGDA